MIIIVASKKPRLTFLNAWFPYGWRGDIKRCEILEFRKKYYRGIYLEGRTVQN